MNYQVVSGSCSSEYEKLAYSEAMLELEAHVREYMKLGWSVQGGVCVTAISQTHDYGRERVFLTTITASQAMVWKGQDGQKDETRDDGEVELSE